MPRHYNRITPVDMNDPAPPESPDTALLRIANQAPGARDSQRSAIQFTVLWLDTNQWKGNDYEVGVTQS